MSAQPQSQPIYLDYNATSPLAPSVRDAVIDAMYTAWHNPSSASPGGRRARSIIDGARRSLARLIGCLPDELVFTSGGTESNNWAIHLALTRFYAALPPAAAGHQRPKPHIVSSCIEHDSIRLPIERLEARGDATVTWLPVDPRTGSLAGPRDVLDALIVGRTCLVALMWANNETGAIFPIDEISESLTEWRKKVRESSSGSTAYAASGLPLFHTDACQAVGKVPIGPVDTCGPDMLSLAGHKLQAPRGIGALYLNASRCPRSSVEPLFLGGGQECGLRPGTEDTSAIAGLGAAAELAIAATATAEAATAMTELRDRLRRGLEAGFQELQRCSVGYGLRVNNAFPLGRTLPNTLNVSIVDVEVASVPNMPRPDAVAARNHLLARGRLLASAGSACHASAGGPSRVLLRSGVEPLAARSALRLSLGPGSGPADVDAACAEVVEALKECWHQTV